MRNGNYCNQWREDHPSDHIGQRTHEPLAQRQFWQREWSMFHDLLRNRFGGTAAFRLIELLRMLPNLRFQSRLKATIALSSIPPPPPDGNVSDRAIDSG